jgi:hypothetical protein
LKDKTDHNRERSTGNYYSKNERKVKKSKEKKRKEGTRNKESTEMKMIRR